jgi:hypothetical protein
MKRSETKTKRKRTTPNEINRNETKVGTTMHDRNRRLARLAGTVVAATVSCGALAAIGPLGAAGASVASPRAHVTRTVSLEESGQLHLLSKHGFTLNEQGIASGTIRGPISVRLTIVSTSRVSAEVTISPNGGSISGSGTGSYHKGETSASFAGSLSIAHSSGSYARAQGSGLSVSGTIARSNDAIAVHVSGRFSD